jgi:hypothetical protein
MVSSNNTLIAKFVIANWTLLKETGFSAEILGLLFAFGFRGHDIKNALVEARDRHCRLEQRL